MTQANGVRHHAHNTNQSTPCLRTVRKRTILAVSLGTLAWWSGTFPTLLKLNTDYLSSVVVHDVQIAIPGDVLSSSVNANTKSKQCAPREGVIVSNTLGRLANNLFEVGFANRMAADLCWTVLYRPFWQGEIPNPRAAECFPRARLPMDHRLLTISQPLQDKLQLNATFWWDVTDRENEPYLRWLAKLEDEGLAMKVGVNEASFFTGDGPNMIVEQIRNETSLVRVLSLEAFFIHGDWMRDWKDKIREWFAMNELCCHAQPPEDAVVIHVRDFEPNDHTNQGFKPPVYWHILEHYNLTERPLWIVCQPSTVDSAFVKELIAASPSKNATIVTGSDQYDAFCTLTRAKTLLLTSASTFSQMAGFLTSPAAEVHYPLKHKDLPPVTLEVPGWKYHRVDANSLDRVIEFQVPTESITFQAA